jgi:hypothetical protein
LVTETSDNGVVSDGRSVDVSGLPLGLILAQSRTNRRTVKVLNVQKLTAKKLKEIKDVIWDLVHSLRD